jgi:Sulfotransferase domain
VKIHEAEKVCTEDIKFINSKRYKLPLRLMFQRKKTHAFCVGTPKSGTHSVANLFSNFRTKHEPSQVFMIYLMNKKKLGQISASQLKHIFKAANIANWLEIDSSHYNGFFIEELYSTFSDAKYILTIRDPISWLDSWFNHQLSRENYKSDTMFDLGRRLYYDRGHSYSKHDNFLEELNIFPVRSYFEFWSEHNKKILETIPKEKLMLVKTKDISSSIVKFSEFLDIDQTKICNTKSHSYKAREKHHILSRIDKNYLLDLAIEICGELNDKYFPESPINSQVEKYSSSA